MRGRVGFTGGGRRGPVAFVAGVLRRPLAGARRRLPRPVGFAAGAAVLLAVAACGSAPRQRTLPSPSPEATATATPGDRRARAARHRARRPHTAARAVAIGAGPAKHRRVALTFDADMTPQMLRQIRAGEAPEQVNREVIATLRRTHTPATLFITGLWAERYPDEVRALARAGFAIANHTWDHRAWTGDCYGLPGGMTAAEKRAQIRRTARLLRRLTGREPAWFRFPGLCHDADALRIARAAGEQTVDGLASGDAFQSDPAAIVRTVLSQVHPGAIIVAHLTGAPNAPATGPALARLIPELRARGYRFVTLDQLFGRT